MITWRILENLKKTELQEPVFILGPRKILTFSPPANVRSKTVQTLYLYCFEVTLKRSVNFSVKNDLRGRVNL